MPKVERAVALLVSGTSTRDGECGGIAIVPKSGGSPTYGAITFGHFGRRIIKNEPNLTAMTAPMMLSHPRNILI